MRSRRNEVEHKTMSMAIAVSGNYNQPQAQAQSGVAGKHGKHCAHGKAGKHGKHGKHGKAGKHGKHGKHGKAGKHGGIGHDHFSSPLHGAAPQGNSMALAASGNIGEITQILSSLLGGGQNQANAGMNPGLGGMLRSFGSVGF